MKHFLIVVCLLVLSGMNSYSQYLTDSNLPIIIIATDRGVSIPDSPRILADMKIIYRGEGLRNYLADQNTGSLLDYNGRIEIEIRGSSSQTLPKKQYGFSTLLSDNITNNNVSLLGFPADNDWILNGLGFDPSNIRDYLNYNLSRMMGNYASRTMYCEVIINGLYNGLYILQEKVKQGENRVDVMKINSTDNNYPELSGGYITKADKTSENDPVAWRMSSYIGAGDVSFIHELPNPGLVTSKQAAYIRSEFEKLSRATSIGDVSFDYGFPSVIDVPSFIDYLILSEFSANADAYQFSTFFHKDRNGKLRAGPIWDMNITYGNDITIWGFDRSKTNTWQFANGDNEGAKFWRDLFNNNEFRCLLAKRWEQLIKPGQTLNYYVVAALIDKTVSLLTEANSRDNQKWNKSSMTLAEITKIKDFIKLRTTWITANLYANDVCRNPGIPSLVISRIMYHPDTTSVFSDSDQQEFIEIRNVGNNTADLTGIYFRGTGFVYEFPKYSSLKPASSLILASNSVIFRNKFGISPFGQFTRNLSNSGETLILADGFGNVIDSVKYSDLPPWPNVNGNGFYLELLDPLSDNSSATNWVASSSVIVSVEDIEPDNSLKMYPLPVKNTLTIESSYSICTLKILDIQGRVLLIKNIDSNRYEIDMSSFPIGIYLLKCETINGSWVRKVIKD